MTTYQIRVAGSDAVFDARGDELIVDAALRGGLLLPHDCRCGGCGGCKARVLCGEIDHGDALDTTLSPAERAQGYALLCCAQPRSDLLIEPAFCEKLADTPLKRLALRVLEVRRLSPERTRIRLDMPPAKRLRFRAGQSLEVLFSDGTHRRYAISSAADEAHVLEFEVPHLPGDRHARYLCDGVQRGQALRIEGPHDAPASSLAA